MSDQNDAKLANSCWLTLNIICNYCVHVLELNQLCWSCSLWFYGIQLLIQTMIMIYSKAIKSLFSHSLSFVMIKYLLLLLFKFRSFSNLDHLFSSFFSFAFNIPKNKDHNKNVFWTFVVVFFCLCRNMNPLCKVCADPAAGYHFGAFTCEGCKVRCLVFVHF